VGLSLLKDGELGCRCSLLLSLNPVIGLARPLSPSFLGAAPLGFGRCGSASNVTNLNLNPLFWSIEGHPPSLFLLFPKTTLVPDGIAPPLAETVRPFFPPRSYLVFNPPPFPPSSAEAPCSPVASFRQGFLATGGAVGPVLLLPLRWHVPRDPLPTSPFVCENFLWFPLHASSIFLFLFRPPFVCKIS